MKKCFLIFICSIFILICISCGKVYEVKFVTNSDNSVDSVTIPENELLELPEPPVKDGYIFAGWFLDEACSEGKEWHFDSDKVTGSFTLYAKWIEDPNLKLNEKEKVNLSADGYVRNKITNFDQYLNTDAYRVVKTPEEFVTAIEAAKYHYQNVWDEEKKTYTQIPAEGYDEKNMLGKVHVIEIANDLNMGYYKLSDELKQKTSILEDFCRKTQAAIQSLTMSDMFLENGMTQIKVENTSNLLIYSKNGAKLTHCGFKLTSDTNVVVRNLEFDELWQWEDTSNNTVAKIGDYDYFGWAYFKIAFCDAIWIDHCTFGKSYDGQIDYANPVYNANAGTAFRAPFGASGSNGLHISWCNFQSGSDDKNGYIYKMLSKIEEDYQNGNKNYLYYNQLRDSGASFDDILYGIAIPQKKGFLCGDSGNNKEDYEYNLSLQISFANCYFKNLEDRIPKLRGGNAVLFNSIVDSSQYYEYRVKLKSMNLASKVAQVNSSWKCGLVSQGILCGNGGSILAQNCKFIGIDTILKNNDSNTADKVIGGYQLINCSYQKSKDDAVLTSFSNFSSSALKEEYFSWHTDDKKEPFIISDVKLRNLLEFLTHEDYGVGCQPASKFNFLIANYS